ncbi:nuclear fragile X mental retardation-interacting protein 2 isoform X2 [Clupea harengus]|uniref:Nuclear fragile X mental retardation-interacting protein 2 isoform X2 n=1 Tax=Clupea harengus TaxID=7950 RepID=A0A6P3VMD2_CLUHA|nr:nuclear fragile X mental retardation-interacting protein 2 isoform X2 [Clupea harengus]
MQQELWLRARAQVLSSLSSVCAMRAASDPHPHPHPLRTTEGGQISGSYPSVPNGIAGAGDNHPHSHPHGPPFHSSPRPGHVRSRTSGHTLAHANNHHHHHRDAAGSDGLPDGFQLLHNPPKVVRSHQELHKELLLAHKKRGRDLVVGSRPELHMVLERRKKEQSQRQEEEQAKGPLEHVLLKRQQKHEENAREEEERVRDEAQLMEFVRVRQNLRKIHSALQSKATNS